MSDYRMSSTVLGQVQTNCYFVWNHESREAVVIDPADNARAIDLWLKNNGLTLKGIFLTHGHFDHMLAAPDLRKMTGAPIYAGVNEKDMLNNSMVNLSGAWIGRPTSFDADQYLNDGDTFDLIGFNWTCIETPGHTSGGVCYYLQAESQLFCGDTLFQCSYGRTDLPTGSTKTLFKSLREKIFVLPKETICYPGHMDATTIEFELGHNPVARGM